MRNHFINYASYLVILIILSITSIQAQAQISASDQDKALNQLERQRQRDSNWSRELGRRYLQKQLEKVQPTITVDNPENIEIPPSRCFNVKNINVKDVTVFSEKVIHNITQPYLNTCMTLGDINKIMRSITNHYMNKGYVTSRALLPQQNLSEGVLEITVLEGKIEKILLNKNSWQDKLQIKMAFPNIHNKILNIRDIEQGLDQINRLDSSKAKMNINPGNKNGYSIIVVNNKTGNKNNLKIVTDNSGQDITGRNQASVTFERDNLLGLGEYMSLSFNRDADGGNARNGVQNISSTITVPYGWWTLSLAASQFEFNTQINASGQIINNRGKTESGTIALNRVITRDQNSKTSAQIGLTHRNTISFIADQESLAGTRALSIFETAIDHTHRAFNSIFYTNLGYERGLDILGARSDNAQLSFTDPRAQFDKFILDASIYKPFMLKEQNIAYRMLVSGQYSSDPLFSSQQIIIGDRFTVRGFSQEAIVGEMGGYVRNELMIDMPRFYSNNKHISRLAGSLQGYAGLDLGGVRQRGGKSDTNHFGQGFMSGWALGLRNSEGIIDFDVAYSKAIKSPGFINEADNGELFFTLGLRLGF